MKRKERNFGSDLKRVDAHIIQPHEYDELPLLTDEAFARGVWKRNDKIIGRPKKADKKVSVHLRLDPAILAAFRATGRGWQSRINALLCKHMPA